MPRTARTLALANQKGGVAKTTTTLNLGVALRERGLRVLGVDLDPQSNLSMSQGIDVEGLETTMYDVLVSGVPMAEVIHAGREAMTTTQTPPTSVPSRLKLALAPPILVLGGFGLFGVAWDSELLAVLFVGFLAIACGIVGVIPGLVIAIHAALRWQTSEPPVRVVIGLPD